MPSPSRSSLISLSSSTSRLSNWTTTRSGIVARSIGAMSMSGAAVTSMPPEWIDRWRGKPSIRAQNSSQRSQSQRSCVRAAQRLGRRLRLHARDLGAAPRPGPSPASAAPAGPSGTAGRAGRSGAAAARACRSPGRSSRPWTSAGGSELLPLSRVAGPAARPQPGHARRRVAGTALVVVPAARPDRRRRLRRAFPHPGLRRARLRPHAANPVALGPTRTGARGPSDRSGSGPLGPTQRVPPPRRSASRPAPASLRSPAIPLLA